MSYSAKAIYHGKKYDATVNDDGTVELISYDCEDENNGFILIRHIAFIKKVARDELDELIDIEWS